MRTLPIIALAGLFSCSALRHPRPIEMPDGTVRDYHDLTHDERRGHWEREGFTQKEAYAITQRGAFVGMSSRALAVSLGRPTRTSTTHSRAGSTFYHWYGSGPLSLMVAIEDGSVTYVHR